MVEKHCLEMTLVIYAILSKTRACIFAHGALYVLYDGGEVYRLSDQMVSEEFAGKQVRVTGRLDPETQTIHMVSINPEK